MTGILKRIVVVGAMSLIILLGATGNAHAARNVSIPSFLGNPGRTVSIPILVDNATSLASIQLQINFNPEILGFVSATNDGLGAGFELAQSATNGVVTLILTRSTALLSGSGRLAVLQFQVNPGAQQGMSSDLAIAQCNLTDESGVLQLNLAEPVTPSNGAITVTNGVVDNNNDKIPDDWEASVGLSTIDPNSGDSDGDGINDLLEYALGMNPKVANGNGLPTIGINTTNGVANLTLEFNRRCDANLEYLVEESSDLSHWQLIDQTTHMIDVPFDLGNGFEKVKVRGDFQMSGPNSQPKGFLRLRVSPR